jgi:hypothetical protein
VCLQSADPSKNLIVGITESAGANTLWILENFYTNEAKNLSENELFDLLEDDIKKIVPGAEHLIVTPWFWEKDVLSAQQQLVLLFLI